MRKNPLFSVREWLADKTGHAQYPTPRIRPARKVTMADNQPLRLAWKHPIPGVMRLALGLLGLFWTLFFAVALGGTVILAAGALLGLIIG